MRWVVFLLVVACATSALAQRHYSEYGMTKEQADEFNVTALKADALRRQAEADRYVADAKRSSATKYSLAIFTGSFMVTVGLFSVAGAIAWKKKAA